MNDLISRKQAIEAITDELDKMDHVPQWVFDKLERAIKQLPPAQPAQLEQCPIYGGMCCYPSDQCYDCPRHAGAKMEREVTT